MKLVFFCLTIIGVNSRFSANGKSAILKVHNHLRSTIAKGMYDAKGTIEPPAANMRKMKWDTVIAASAQKYANLCPDDHSNVSNRGENLFWSLTSFAPTNLDEFGVEASKSWEQEFQDYGWSSTTLDKDTFNSGIGHATQMAWAETNLIGCGVKNCGREKDDTYKVAVVCQYKSA
ncbi:hypothetical protein CRE_07809 [Caenorhabditis remanei]|uniref:SCP domain-containing protein n=1 Tax=Caenorhabditis remanei TaxID=31234 RepID=E3NEI9_CAERE|nr:hypothetical protein CRE_07809 [Caenorhabditis remanei]